MLQVLSPRKTENHCIGSIHVTSCDVTYYSAACDMNEGSLALISFIDIELTTLSFFFVPLLYFLGLSWAQ